MQWSGSHLYEHNSMFKDEVTVIFQLCNLSITSFIFHRLTTLLDSAAPLPELLLKLRA
jgi:hypothetical protein